MFKFNLMLMYSMCAFVVSVCIKLRHCGHLALSSCLTLRAKYNVNMFGCIEGLRVYYTVLSCVAACLVRVSL